MDEKKDGIELLREYAEGKKEKRFCPILHGHYGDVDGDCMRGTCAECEGGYLAALADRIEREREEAAEEAREVAGRLRGMRGYESRHANFNLIYLACFGFDAPMPTTDREDFAAVRDRLCDLIERGGKRDPEREKAADWVEANGGLDEVSGKLDAYDAIDDEREYLMELRAEVSARLGIGLDGIAPAEAHARIIGELDKRLMPEGMEWPPKDCEGEDLRIGEKAHFLRTGYDGDHEWDDVIVAFRHQGLEGEGDAWIVVGEKGEAFACDCAVERPAVLAADGLPIEVGQTVYDGIGMELTIARIVPRESCVSVDHVKCTKKDNTAVYDLLPSELTHTPPDTQERIDEDATMPPRAYYAKHIGHDVGLKDDAECTEAMVRHLLNRQRGLDKRMMGGAE